MVAAPPSLSLSSVAEPSNGSGPLPSGSSSWSLGCEFGTLAGHSGESGDRGGGVRTRTFFTGFDPFVSASLPFDSVDSASRKLVLGGAVCVCVVSMGSRVGKRASSVCTVDLRKGFDDAMAPGFPREPEPSVMYSIYKAIRWALLIGKNQKSSTRSMELIGGRLLPARRATLQAAWHLQLAGACASLNEYLLARINLQARQGTGASRFGSLVICRWGCDWCFLGEGPEESVSFFVLPKLLLLPLITQLRRE